MSQLFESIITGTDLTVTAFLICLAASLFCGVCTAFAAGHRTAVSKSFLVSLILLPPIVATVITMVNGNIGTGVAVMGAFSLVRFRSVPGKARDIVSIFLAMTAGLACASGYVGIAILFTVLICLIMLATAHIPMGEERTMELSVTVPETLHIADAFADLFAEYTKRHRLVRTKTTNMGSLYKLFYRVEMKDPRQIQAFIDALRCRNGNLEISLAEAAEGSDML